MATEFNTLNNLIEALRDISTRHRQINSFGLGDAWEIGVSNALIHPSLWVNPVSADMAKGDNGYSSWSVDFNIKLFDLVNKDESNEEEVMSDSLEILKDVINEFNTHPFYIASDFNIVGDISFESFTERYDEEVTGWETTFTLLSPNRRSFCGSPIDSITGYSFVPELCIVTDNLATPSTIELRAGDSYTCTVGSAATYTITNSGSTFSTGITADYQLENITHIDSDGSPIDRPAQVGFTATTCTGTSTVFSGITYDRPLVTGQMTQYRTGDDAWHLSNGTYKYTAPTSPINYAQIDKDAVDPYKTLLHNNAFGNKNRFTDSGGTQTYTGDYVIDHLTGLGWYRITQPPSSWNDAIDNAVSSTQGGFSDWRVANMSEYYSVLDRDNSADWLDYAPFNHNNTVRKWSSTTDSNTTTSALFWQRRTFASRGKTLTDPIHFIVRNHYTGSTISSSSILYARPKLTGQRTFFRNGDDASHLTGGTYDYTPPANIVSVAQSDTISINPFLNLKENNAFGNKSRFTNSTGGTASFDGSGGELADYTIDHLTGLGWFLSKNSLVSWNTAIDNAVASSDAGFSDWRLANPSELNDISNFDLTSGALDYVPMDEIGYVTGDDVWSSTTDRDLTTNSFVYQARASTSSGWNWKREPKTNNNYYIFCRNHYN